MSEYVIGEDGKHVDVFPNVSSIPLDYDLYLVSGTSPQAREIRNIGRFLKEKNRAAIVGGPHVTNYAGIETPTGVTTISGNLLPTDMELVSNYPVMIKNEGENIIFEAIERIEEGMRAIKDFNRGIVLRGPMIEDLGTIPIPDRSNAHKYSYFLEDKNGENHRCTHIMTSRGCPKRCAFCDSPGLWTRKVRYTPLNRIKEELEQIRSFGFSSIQIYDDIFPLNRSRMIEICRYLKNMGFLWRCYMRADIMTQPSFGRPILEIMHDSGMIQTLVGIESGSQQILDNIYKDVTVEQNTEICRLCKEVGIVFKASVILGLPGETMETMEATRRWVLENRPDRCGVNVFIPYRGTPIVDQKMRRQYGVDDMHDFDLDVSLEPGEADEFYYYGSRTKLQVVVSTSSLTAQQIHEFYLKFQAELEAEGIPY